MPLTRGQKRKITDRPIPKTNEATLKADDSGILPELLTPKQVSALINIPTSSLAKFRMEGALPNRTELPPFVKVGRRIRYRRSAVFAWLDGLQVHGAEA